MPREARLLFMIDSLAADGAQTAMLNLIEGLASRGYKQAVIALNSVVAGRSRSALSGLGVPLHVIGRRAFVLGWGMLAALQIIRRMRPDIAMTWLFVSDNFGRVAARIAGVPVVVSSVRAVNTGKSAFQLAMDRLTAPLADKITANSQSAIAFARQHEGVRESQAVHIRNGTRVLPEVGDVQRINARRILNVGSRAITVGSVARMFPVKGHRILLQGFASFASTHPSARLLLAGDGPERPSLERAAAALNIADRVSFLGICDDVHGVLAALDVFVHASYSEGMPNSVMEAMAAGLPVIATQIGGTGDLIEDGVHGWLVPPGNPESIARALEEVFADRSESRRRAAAAASRMRTEFSLETMTQRYDELFRSLLAGRKVAL